MQASLGQRAMISKSRARPVTLPKRSHFEVVFMILFSEDHNLKFQISKNSKIENFEFVQIVRGLARDNLRYIVLSQVVTQRWLAGSRGQEGATNKVPFNIGCDRSSAKGKGRKVYPARFFQKPYLEIPRRSLTHVISPRERPARGGCRRGMVAL